MGRTVTKTSLVLVLSICALLVSCWSQGPDALADDSSIGVTGGSVYPIWTTDIRLDAETVQATCFGTFVEYRVDFRFVNEGRARTIKLGFPFTDTVGGERYTERPFGFQAWQDGDPLTVQAVPARYKNGKATAGYYVHKAYFPRGATTITVSYLAEPSATAAGRRMDDPSNGNTGWLCYWLHSGATWKGPIGEAVVRYRLADSFRGREIELTAEEVSEGVRVTSPAGWTTPLPRTYQWRFIDFEPTSAGDSHWWETQSPYDVTLAYTNVFTSRPADGEWTWSSAAEFWGYEAAYYGIGDGSLSRCWAEGIAGPGIGEWVEARFKRPQRVREVRILPGNNEYLSAFTKYARPKTLRAVFSDGSSTLLQVDDAPTLQRFPVDVRTRAVRLVVESVYLGTDYPATCVSEVQFGTEVAPGYAVFGRLLADDEATGRLTAWAGPAAPAPTSRSRSEERLEAWDAEDVACGDLIGVDKDVSFPADQTPLKESATLEDITERTAYVPLPDGELVGEPTEVNALSYWTYEVRYESGIDLLVNTALSRVPSKSVLAELAEEAGDVVPYEDERRLPYDVRAIGDCVVGVARPGVISYDCSSSSDCSSDAQCVPGQVFWRDHDLSYHLYARSEEVTIDEFVDVATSLIDPTLLEVHEDAPNRTARGWLVTLVAITMVAVVVAVVVRRRKAVAPPDS